MAKDESFEPIPRKQFDELVSYYKICSFYYWQLYVGRNLEEWKKGLADGLSIPQNIINAVEAAGTEAGLKVKIEDEDIYNEVKEAIESVNRIFKPTDRQEDALIGFYIENKILKLWEKLSIPLDLADFIQRRKYKTWNDEDLADFIQRRKYKTWNDEDKSDGDKSDGDSPASTADSSSAIDEIYDIIDDYNDVSDIKFKITTHEQKEALENLRNRTKFEFLLNDGFENEVDELIIPEEVYGYVAEAAKKDKFGTDPEHAVFHAIRSKGNKMFYTVTDKLIAEEPVQPETKDEKRKKLIMLDACYAACKREGVSVYFKQSWEARTDAREILSNPDGYWKVKNDDLIGHIVIKDELTTKKACEVLIREWAHSGEVLYPPLAQTASMIKRQAEGESQNLGPIINFERASRFRQSLYNLSTPKIVKYPQADTAAVVVSKTFGFNTNKDYRRRISSDRQASMAQRMIEKITAELDIKGFNIDLTEKPRGALLRETVESIARTYECFVEEYRKKIEKMSHSLSDYYEYEDISGVSDILAKRRENLTHQLECINTIYSLANNLRMVESRDEQDRIIKLIERCQSEIETLQKYACNKEWSLDYLIDKENTFTKSSIVEKFCMDPMRTLQQIKPCFPKLSELTDDQIKYIALSKPIKSLMLEINNIPVTRKINALIQFVNNACLRAEQVSNFMRKYFVCVEINSVEGDISISPIGKGSILTAKAAETNISSAMKKVIGMEAEAAEARKRGERPPYSTINVTIYGLTLEGLSSIETTISAKANRVLDETSLAKILTETQMSLDKDISGLVIQYIHALEEPSIGYDDNGGGNGGGGNGCGGGMQKYQKEIDSITDLKGSAHLHSENHKRRDAIQY